MTDALSNRTALTFDPTGAPCRTVDPDMFFPAPGRPVDALPAVRLCLGCHVRDDCLRWAMDNQPAGVWGATTEAERQKMHRRRTRARAAEAAA